MSENQNIKKSAPMKPMAPVEPGSPRQAPPMTKTSAVPIRKETVRVTLKAPPQAGTGPTAPPPPLAPAPPVPAPTSPIAKKSAETVSKSPSAPAPAPTVPLQAAGAPTAPAVAPVPAPTVKLQTGAGSGPATKLATPAPTVKLNTPTGGPGTVPLATPGATSQQLPKATVQLASTQQMGQPATPSQAATIQTYDGDDVSSDSEGVVAALSIVSFVAALIVLGVQLMTANIWLDGKWGDLFN